MDQTCVEKKQEDNAQCKLLTCVFILVHGRPRDGSVRRDLGQKPRPTQDKQRQHAMNLTRIATCSPPYECMTMARRAAMIDKQISANVRRIYDEPCADVVKRSRASCVLMAALANAGFAYLPLAEDTVKVQFEFSVADLADAARRCNDRSKLVRDWRLEARFTWAALLSLALFFAIDGQVAARATYSIIFCVATVLIYPRIWP
jgi:hypothetical protein